MDKSIVLLYMLFPQSQNLFSCAKQNQQMFFLMKNDNCRVRLFYFFAFFRIIVFSVGKIYRQEKKPKHSSPFLKINSCPLINPKSIYYLSTSVCQGLVHIVNVQEFQSGPVPGTFTRLRSCTVPAEITEPPPKLAVVKTTSTMVDRLVEYFS